ncbi:alpha/beta hydrolase [Shewanella sp. OPT22]|nr:alpha/beta hydrolase [Shewanella sp. OPT22]
MSSWQANILNLILSYVAKPSISRGKSKVPISEVRKRMLNLDQRWKSWPKDLTSDGLELSNCRMLMYKRKGATNPPKAALFYVRGGGFCFKTPNSHAHFITDVMHKCDLDAFIPDYRLAPEHPFPASIDDVLVAYKKLTQLHPELPIIVMGDSAGGNLSASLLLDIKRLGLTQPKACVLISPALDLALLGDAEETLASEDPFFTVESLFRLRSAYLDGQNPMNERASPIVGDFNGTPPIMVFAGTKELLLQDSVRLVNKIEHEGGQIIGHFYPDMPHVFPLFEVLPEATRARKQIYRFIKENLSA